MSTLVDRLFVEAYTRNLEFGLNARLRWVRYPALTERQYWREVRHQLRARFAEWAHEDYCATGVKR